MRIALIVEAFPSVSETFISNKVKQLSTRGYTVCVFCSRLNNQLFAQLFEKNAFISVFEFSIKSMVLYYLSHPFAALPLLAGMREFKRKLYKKFRIKAINRFKPDIVHFEFSPIAIDYADEIDLLRGKKIVSCRGTGEKVKLLMSPVRQRKFKALLEKTARVHCVSDDMAKTLLPYLKEQEKIFINYPSIDPSFFKNENKGAGENTGIILSVGRIFFQKGFTNGLFTMRILKQMQVPFKWIIAGTGAKQEELIFKIHQLGLQENVELAGAIPHAEVKILLQRATVFYLPSVYEGIANVALEAMSMQLPVVATRSGGMGEVITHGYDGMLAGIFDFEAQAKYLQQVLEDENFARQLGRHARETINKRFTIDKQISVFENIYTTVTEK